MENYLVMAVILLHATLPFSSESESSFVFPLKDAPEIYKDYAKRYHRTFKKTEQKVLPNQYADYSDDERIAYLRKHHKHIDPELRTLLRMGDKHEQNDRNELRLGPRRPKQKGNGYGKSTNGKTIAW